MKERAFRMLAGVLLLLASAQAQAQRAEATESSVKAAFLYKFAAYVEWPPQAFADPAAPFVIGVMDDDKIAADLARIVRGRSIAGHAVTARPMKEGDSAKGVHVVFIGENDPAALAKAVRAAQRDGALVVTSSPNGLASGSEINFIVSNDHVGFEVSLDAAQRGGHHISARMLAVARRVVQKGG